MWNDVDWKAFGDWICNVFGKEDIGCTICPLHDTMNTIQCAFYSVKIVDMRLAQPIHDRQVGNHPMPCHYLLDLYNTINTWGLLQTQNQVQEILDDNIIRRIEVD